MYSVADFAWMINDRTRTGAYVRALQAADPAGKVVLDIGTGTGVFALLACRMGARRVYAVEPGDVIEVARQAARANGLAGCITFIQDLSTAITLPEPADIIIADLRGNLPLYGRHLPSMADAAARHLTPAGIVIPQQDDLCVAVLESPQLYESCAPSWLEDEYNIDLSPARRFAVHTSQRTKAEAKDILLPPRRWATIDYRQISSPDVDGEVAWSATRSGTAHGFLVWFDTVLAPGIGFSNAPDRPELIYRRRFFPFAEPVPLAPDDVLSLRIRANLTGDEYIWRWDTRVTGGANPGTPKAHFRQSTFFDTPRSPSLLRKRAAGHIPSLNDKGQMDRLILDLMDRQTPLQDIATQLLEQYPADFPGWPEALAYVGKLSQKYSR